MLAVSSAGPVSTIWAAGSHWQPSLPSARQVSPSITVTEISAPVSDTTPGSRIQVISPEGAVSW